MTADERHNISKDAKSLDYIYKQIIFSLDLIK